MNYTLMCW